MYYKLSFIFLFFYLLNFSHSNEILEKDLTIDNSKLSFSSLPLTIDVNSKGNIFIANSDLNTIYIFSKKGKLEKRVAREGRGPGEFVSLVDIFIDKDDKFYALGSNLGKVAIFAHPNYDLSKEIRVPITIPVSVGGRQGPVELFISPQKNLMIVYSDIISLQNPEQPFNSLYSVELSDGSVKETVLSYSDDQFFVYTNGDQIATFEVPFGYKTILKLGPNGSIYLGKTDTDYIQIFNSVGELKKKIGLESTPVPVPKKEMKNIKEVASSNRRGSQIFNELLDAEVIPDNIPVYDWFIVDDKSRIWIALNTEDQQNYSLHILDKDGELIAKTSLPKSVELQVVRDGYAYGVQEADNGIQTVVRYKIKGLGG